MLSLSLACCVVWCVACGDDDESATDGGTDTGRPSLPTCDDTPLEGAPTEALEIGALIDGAFVAWSDGERVPYVWGFQGGTMIQPMVRVPESLGRSECITLDVFNDPDPAFPDEFAQIEIPGMTDQLPLVLLDGRYVAGPLPNQLGWMELDAHFQLRITARSESYVAEQTLLLETVMPTSACDELSITGDECLYEEIPGRATIMAIEGDAITFEEFIPGSASWSACLPPFATGVVQLPDGCVSSAGLEVSGQLSIIVRKRVTGACDEVVFTSTACRELG